MFSLNTNISQTNIRVYVTYKDKKLEFPLTPIVKPNNKANMVTDMQFDLVNQYVDYKGEDFKSKLFDTLSKARQDVIDSGWFYGLRTEDTGQLPYYLIDGLINMLDLNDMIYFVKEVLKIQPLGILHDEFLDIMETDGMGTRNQTYVKEDYLKLVGLSIYIKIVLLPVLMYGHLKQDFLNNNNKEYLLFHFFTKYPIMESDPMKKIIKYIEEVVNKSSDEPIIINTFVFNNSIPREDIVCYMLSLAVFQRIFLYAHKADFGTQATGNKGNIISNMYSFIKDTLEKAASKIQDKTRMKDKDGDDEESILESYRTVSNLSYGFIQEFLWATKDINSIIEQLPPEQAKYISKGIITSIKPYVKLMKEETIQDIHLFILTTIFKTLIDSRAIYYIGIDNILNLISVGFSYLWNINSKIPAIMLLSSKSIADTDAVNFSTVTNKERVSPELKEELNRFFPYQLPHTDEPKNLVMESIIKLTQDFYQNNWTSHCSPELASEALTVSGKLTDENIRLELVKFVINNERIINKEVLYA